MDIMDLQADKLYSTQDVAEKISFMDLEESITPAQVTAAARRLGVEPEEVDGRRYLWNVDQIADLSSDLIGINIVEFADPDLAEQPMERGGTGEQTTPADKEDAVLAVYWEKEGEDILARGNVQFLFGTDAVRNAQVLIFNLVQDPTIATVKLIPEAAIHAAQQAMKNTNVNNL